MKKKDGSDRADLSSELTSLHRLSKRYAAILESIPDIIMEVDDRKVYTWANLAGLRFFGDDVIGHEAVDFFIGEQETYATVHPLFKGEENVIYVESWQRRRDGAPRLLAWWCKVLKDECGRVTGAISTARDITDIRTTEEIIQSSERRFKAVFENAVDGIIIASPDRRFVMVNSQICTMLGYTKEELTGLSIDDIHPPESIAEVVAHFERQVRGEESIAENLPVLRSDGKVIYCDIAASQIVISDKMYIVGFFRDITNKRNVEQACADNEALFRNFIQASPLGIHIYRLDEYFNLIFNEYNPAADRILGTDHAPFIGKKIDEAFPPLAATEVPERYRRAALYGEPWYCEQIDYEHGRIKGAFEIYAFQIIQGSMAVMFSEITEKKKTLETLRQQRDLINRIMETSPVGISMVDRSGTIIFANRKAEDVLGLSRSSIAGRTYNDPEWKISDFDGNPMPDTELPFELIKRTSEGVSDIRHRIEWPNGNIVYLSIGGSPLFNDKNEFDGCVFSIEDITEDIRSDKMRKELEEQLNHSQKMESIGRLAGGIAHDLNNLLTPIIGYSDHILKKLIAPADPLYEMISEISDAATRSRSLTHQLLAFGRKQPLEMQVTNCNALIFDFVKILKRTIRENIKVKTILDPGLFNTRVDSAKIDQIILNLAVNAQDAMPEGGTFTIETFNAVFSDADENMIDLAVPGEYAVMRLADTGAGIEPETLRHIFEPFFTTKAKGFGTGLGLATVYGIVKQHDGHIQVKSEKGKGTTFTIHFPAVKADVIPVMFEDRPIAPALRDDLVLVVEDNESVRVMTEKLIESLGYTVITAASGEEAVRLASANPAIRLILTDVIIPDINGVEVYTRIKKIIPDIKVVYMSGYTDDVIVHHGVLEDGASFIMKPFTLGQLADKFSKILGG